MRLPKAAACLYRWRTLEVVFSSGESMYCNDIAHIPAQLDKTIWRTGMGSYEPSMYLHRDHAEDTYSDEVIKMYCVE